MTNKNGDGFIKNLFDKIWRFLKKVLGRKLHFITLVTIGLFMLTISYGIYVHQTQQTYEDVAKLNAVQLDNLKKILALLEDLRIRIEDLKEEEETIRVNLVKLKNQENSLPKSTSE